MSDADRYTLETPENIQVHFELAGLGTRFCAMLLDTLLLVVVTAALVIVLVLTFSAAAAFNFKRGGQWVAAVVVALLVALALGRLLHPLRMAHAGPDAGQEGPEDPRHSRRRHAGDDP